MKTLLFCTAYASSPDVWDTRYKPWYEHYTNSNLAFDRILLIDDGSSSVPDFCKPNEFYQFETHLGRQALYLYPGWYRSFGYAVKYAQENEYQKIVHAESDAYFLSDRILSFINSTDSGWHTFWCARHNLCESALQIIGPDMLGLYRSFIEKPYEEYSGKCLDLMLPYTTVHKEFIGDRYGEWLSEIPEDADYSCQTTPEMVKRWGV